MEVLSRRSFNTLGVVHVFHITLPLNLYLVYLPLSKMPENSGNLGNRKRFLQSRLYLVCNEVLWFIIINKNIQIGLL